MVAAVVTVLGVGASMPGVGAGAGGDAPEATEVGVSDSTISIAVVADVENQIAPGLFSGARAAIDGFAKYINKNGGLAGRKLEVEFIDSHLSPTDSRNAMIKACEDSFAVVGTAALFLQSVDDLVECTDQAGNPTGLPDIPIVTTEIAHQCSPVSYGPNPSQLDCATKDDVPQTWRTNIGEIKYYRKNLEKDLNGTFIYGNDLKAAAIGGLAIIRGLVDAGVTPDNEIGISSRAPQTEYTPVVQRLKETDSNYSMNTGPFASSVALRKEAKLQGVDPESVIWECAACYEEAFLEQGGSDVEGEYVRLNHLPFTDTDNAAMKNFLKFTPEDQVDSFAAYAWVAGLLFRDAVNDVVMKGGNNALTREALLEALRGITRFDGDGMYGTTNVADHVPSPCFVLMQVQDEDFERVHPKKPGTFDCTKSNLISYESDIIGI
jgi:ABC-type branched-subunit amino acid transport system substrate-binding protein